MEEEKNSEMEISLRDLGAVFLHCWWIMLIAAVVVAVALYAFLSSTHRDEYTAEASIYVMRTPDGENTTTSDISIATYLVRDAPDLILSRTVLNDVILKQNRILVYEDLRKMIEITNEENTRILYLSVTAADPEEAADLVNSVAATACDFMNNYMYDGQKLFRQVDYAATPDKPSNPVSLLCGVSGALPDGRQNYHAGGCGKASRPESAGADSQQAGCRPREAVLCTGCVRAIAEE